MTALPMLASLSLSERVVELLEERVLYGEWRPGTRLPSEAELCAQLGVSRSVVRDAMRALAARGLVQVRQGVGTIVSEATDDAYCDATLLLLVRAGATVHEAVEARAAIEEAVAVLAAQARTEEDLLLLRGHFEVVARAADDDDMPLALEADLRFHLGILDATHISVLITLLRPMQQIIWITSLPPPSIGPENHRSSRFHYDVDLHRELLEALESGDGEAARRRMREHFSFVHDPAYRELHSMSIRDAARLRSSFRREIRRRA